MARILVVDDDPDTLEALEAFVALEGFVVETASSVNGALAKIQPGRFDALVLDIQLGNDLGFEIMDGLRQRGISVPAVFVSGWDERGLTEEAKRYGAKLFVKPVDLTELIAHLRALVARDAVSGALAQQ